MGDRNVSYIVHEGMMDVDVLAVVDELMEALAVLNPRLYDGVIRNMEDLA